MYSDHVTEFLTLDQMEDRAIYEVHSRNLAVGMWNERTGGFVGVRLKFGSRFLDTEYFYGDTSGTARPVRKLDVDVPEGISSNEYAGENGSFCQYCDTPTRSLGPGMGTDYQGNPRQVQCIGWTHVNEADRLACEHEGEYMSVHKQNQALFDFLLPLDEANREERIAARK